MFDTVAMCSRDQSEEATTVVVVNADPVARRRLVGTLKSRGHRVIDFANAREAIEAMTLPRRTVLLVDHELEDMSGAQFIDEIRGRGLQLPTIMTVPMHAIQTAVQAIRNGATDVLEEPLDDAVLAQSVRLALAREEDEDLSDPA
ncbi:MAG TPA: response regulator [Gammaproteobacteria bacterium]|nr:response regulator [Gammaproteobacteria bacterium]